MTDVSAVAINALERAESVAAALNDLLPDVCIGAPDVLEALANACLTLTPSDDRFVWALYRQALALSVAREDTTP